MKVRGYIQWLLPSRKWKVLAVIVTGVIVDGGALTLYTLRAHTYLTDNPATCVNCHIMEPYYVMWFHSSHSRNAIYNGCRVPHENAVKKRVFEGMDGICHVAVFLIHGEKDAVHASDEDSEVIMNNCVHCHTQLDTELVSIGWTDYVVSQVGEGEACWDYHRDVPHGGSDSITPTPNTSVPYPDSSTPEWLGKIIE